MSENTDITEKGYELKAITIFSTNGEMYDVFPQMVELNMFEDIYNSTMSGHLVLSDSIDLFATIPLSGFEFIKIIANKKGYSKDILLDKTFRIYKMNFIEVMPVTTSGQTYAIHFCSEENILSISKVISKSYRGKTSSDIITDILLNQLGIKPERILEGNIEQTYGRQDIIIPYLDPFSAINWITSRTLSTAGKSVGPSFMFYENREGYNFKSLEKMFKNETKVKYTYNAKNVDLSEDENSGQEFHDVISYEFVNVFDIINGIKNGMFAGTLKSIDLTRLRADDTVYNYDNDFNDSVHIENNLLSVAEQRKTPHPFHNNNEDRFKKTLTQNIFAFRRMYPTNAKHNTKTAISRRQPGINPNLVESWMLQRASQLNQLNYFKLKLSVPGDTLITIGDIIEFRLPLINSKIKGEKNENPYYSGRYLITAIRHQMNTSKYEMVLEATRDCLSERYKDALNSNSDMKEIKLQ